MLLGEGPFATATTAGRMMQVRRAFASSAARTYAPASGRTADGSPILTGTPDPPPPSADQETSTSEAAATEPATATRSEEPHSLARVAPHPITAPHPAYLASLSRSIRRAASALPTVAGRPPPKEELLSLTNSFFERLKIRFKWATIRSYRRFRADDYSAFFSFGILGTLGWFLLSTTSAFAVFFFLVNSLSLQEWLAGKLGAYLTDSTGVKVVFESAIVPKWGLFGSSASKIVFRNVYLSRGPVKGELGILPVEESKVEETEEQARWREVMSKWTHFHLSIDTVEVSLSLGRWLDGKGLIKDAAVRGVRGVIERSHIQYDPDAVHDRFQYRNKPRPGDFWLEGLKIEDFLVTIYQPDNFRPYTFSIFNADIPRFRKQWLFYDLMSAESVTGQVDNCLFSLHKPQSIGTTSEEDLKNEGWSRMSRFRVDGVPIDHMQTSHDTGVLSWITSGRCDLVADIRFPAQDSEVDLSAIVDHLVDEIGGRLGAAEAAAGNQGRGVIPGRRSLSREALEAPRSEGQELSKKEERRRALQFAKEAEMAEEDSVAGGAGGEGRANAGQVDEDEEDKIVAIDLDVRFRDLKAHVPYFTSDLSYINNALVRPIVAFINRNRTLIPIRCHIDLGLSEFNGSWTTYDVGILERMSEQVYEALAHHVSQANDQRMQTVGLWTLQMTASSVLSALKNNFTLAPY
ncbi:Mitochondrial distribution and morphology protein 31, mitochondrial precursor [Rhodotorula sphaerocarpa]